MLVYESIVYHSTKTCKKLGSKFVKRIIGLIVLGYNFSTDFTMINILSKER